MLLDLESTVIATLLRVAVLCGVGLVPVGQVHAQPTFEAALLTVDTPAPGDGFGASVSTCGDLLLVGAPQCMHDGVLSGSIYVYRRVLGDWQFHYLLSPDDPETGQLFGASVCYRDGTLVVGAPGDSTQGNLSGAVYVYNDLGGVFQLSQKLLPADGELGDQFGVSVAVAGQRLAAGADREDDAGANAGAVYVYELTGPDSWDLSKKLVPAGLDNEDRFGCSVTLMGDTVISGAWLADTTVASAGTVFVFSFDGIEWIQEARLDSPTPTPGESFGKSVSASEERVAVGAPTSPDHGAVFVFERTGGSWSLESTLTPTPVSVNPIRFGNAVVLDGNSLAAAAWLADVGHIDSGAAWLYERSAAATWTEVLHVAASVASVGDQLGKSLALGDGILVAGAPGRDSGGAPNSGATYVFERPRFDAFRRSDCDGNGRFDIADPVAILWSLFVGTTPPPPCLAACDVTDDGTLDISDAVRLLDIQFGGMSSAPPPAPFPDCGLDPTTDSLGCAEYACP